MEVKSIVECTNGSILQYFRPSISIHSSWGSFLFLFLCDRFSQDLLYCDKIYNSTIGDNKTSDQPGHLPCNQKLSLSTWESLNLELSSECKAMCICHFPMSYPGSGVVLDCIDSWSLPSFLLWPDWVIAKDDLSHSLDHFVDFSSPLTILKLWSLILWYRGKTTNLTLKPLSRKKSYNIKLKGLKVAFSISSHKQT